MPARTVALTFDGRPDPVWTPRLLALLRQHNPRATFFRHGAQAARHPELIRRIRAEGHEIMSNTYTGAVLGESSASRFRAGHEMTQSALAGATGRRTNLLRMLWTTSPDTLCGREWQAARRAAGYGYVLVAADKGSRKPAQGIVRELSQTESAYPDLMGLFEAMRRATGGGGRQLNVPVADPDLRTCKGSAVKWDDRRARAPCAALREGRSPG
ncbi:polysaccharide deacetylase family protein [Streptomyces tibetensis]|uniref:polysaccharide deacetylase family protein n=1 Tax=Streptomyces tibetensis TaxID=2382123 RepID=UPI00340E4AC5